MSNVMPLKSLINKIIYLRGQKVMLDSDLAELYGVETRRVTEQVKRNPERFPEDFMYQLTNKEFTILKSQFATSSWGGKRKLPFAFTEQGIAMLSSVLHSERAINVNIAIMRAFVKLRELLLTNKELNSKLQKIEAKYDKQFRVVFEVLKQLMETPAKPRNEIGFKRKKS